MIVVVSDGTGAALIPAGTVRGLVIDLLGRAPGEALAGQLSLQWTSDGPGNCGFMDVGFGVNADGTIQLPCQAGGHTILVQLPVPGVDWQTIGSGHVVVDGGAVVALEIRLDGPWPPPPMP